MSASRGWRNKCKVFLLEKPGPENSGSGKYPWERTSARGLKARTQQVRTVARSPEEEGHSPGPPCQHLARTRGWTRTRGQLLPKVAAPLPTAHSRLGHAAPGPPCARGGRLPGASKGTPHRPPWARGARSNHIDHPDALGVGGAGRPVPPGTHRRHQDAAAHTRAEGAGRRMAGRHSPVTAPPSPPPRSASRAVRCHRRSPATGRPGRTQTRRTPSLRPDAAPQPGSPTLRISGAGSPGSASAPRRKSRPAPSHAGAAGSPASAPTPAPPEVQPRTVVPRVAPAGRDPRVGRGDCTNTVVVFGPWPPGSRPRGRRPCEDARKECAVPAGRGRGGAEGPRVLTAAGSRRPGLAQVRVHRDPGRGCRNRGPQSSPPRLPGAASRGGAGKAAARSPAASAEGDSPPAASCLRCVFAIGYEDETKSAARCGRWDLKASSSLV
ncbi:basic proline-rich protein-like [Camelus dromedarius]|uniref:basic proline-rich protein-like n=1 Tax=Camelus dromedarius TaxID=9838 RepID=UPI00311A5D9D